MKALLISRRHDFLLLVVIICTFVLISKGSFYQAAASGLHTPRTESSTGLILDPTGRINVLLFGTDHFVRPGSSSRNDTIADTVIVLSLEPVRKTGIVLSIPAYTYLDIPGYGKQDMVGRSIVIGEDLNYPGGGPMLGVRTVEQLLGTSIQYYVTVNYDVFRTLVDVVGPVQVCPPEPIHDERYLDYDKEYITVDFPAGCQELNTDKLLQYTRAFHIDEFDRNLRQREVMRAAWTKITNLEQIPALIGNTGKLWGAVKDNLKTNLTFDEILRLVQLAQQVSPDNISFIGLNVKDGYLTESKGPGNVSIWLADYGKVQALVQKLFVP